MNVELIRALEDIEKDKGIPKERLLQAIRAALESAYKKNFGSKQNVEIEIEENTGEVNVYSNKQVVEEVTDPNLEISLTEAQKINPDYELEDVVGIEVTPSNFGRIAAQTAKQVVIQRIREAEREIVYEEFANLEGDILTGIIQRHHNSNVIVDLGRTEALLIPPEQIPNETYESNERIKIYIVEVEQGNKGPKILVSRTHPGLLKRLFELEVPEIHDGIVEIKGVAREAGFRSKIAVYSNDPEVDAIGACVGPNGMRVQAVVEELNGEKIDIIEWNEEPKELIANALSPAEVIGVATDEEEQVAQVVVPDYQLSLAIGKEGQNARLAAKLTGWKIDIKSESQVGEESLEELKKDEQIEDEVEGFDFTEIDLSEDLD
ncbi:NusA antitermination factor [Candidatus Frackibacter sp. WG12]|uniref:transcription termination factor NusA n=1 Tax=unclassified Candidatus Frackibacter TaxID=2648818 RepID=UPI00079803A3|nr:MULTISPECIES: transcription termination factor NusA [unclassified Candidatus Frackibacter]KXS40742.1 MAG: N utilization substance protein A [Candidatus Frackibacter sp. T328-2]SDB98539.1 NusA antitermination factor [Candidatus Frackibacter sp. WG11]SEM30292.1 NusA antitermination factor [Candidatus Frackibacter sp. WG12]